ncbi:MAG: T9SS type A sorting domain-containing protein [Crocinitomicaceae bacterium]
MYWAFNSNNLNQGLDLTCKKYNTIGVEQWSTPFFYGGSGTQQSYIVNVGETALYIGGRECTGLTNTCDMLLLKINKNNGTLIWNETMNFSGNGYDELDGLALKDDGIYCGGWAHELESGTFNADMGFWKLDYSGNTIWTNYLGQTGSAEHQDGHFVVDDNYIFAAGLWNGSGAFNLYNGHSIVGRFDKSNGAMVDTTLFGPQSNNFLDIENALGMTSSGDFLYITGYTTPIAANDWQIFVAKYDKNLNQIWYTDWGGTDAESARGITVVDDVIYVAGLSSSPSIISGGLRDAVLLRLDTSGNVLSYETWGDANENSFRDIYVDNNAIYLSGTSEIDTTTDQKSAFLLKVANGIGGTGKIANDNKIGFNVSPNPSNGEVQILFNNNQHEEGLVNVTDVNGRVIMSKIFSDNVENIDFRITNSGIYFITVEFEKYRISKKVIIN